MAWPLALLAVLLVSGWSTSGRDASRTSTTGRSGNHVSALSLSPDLLSAYFPVSGAEMNRPSAIRTLYDEIYQNGLSACMKAQGFPTPGFEGEAPQHQADMPDLGYIKAHGLIIYGSSDPPIDYTSWSAAKLAARGRAMDTCSHRAIAPLNKFLATVIPLTIQWTNVAATVQEDPSVVRAYAGFVPCLHRAGINVADETGFFAYVDGLHNEQAQYEVASKVYLPCILPVEKVRLPLRESLRTTFFSQYSDELRAAQQAANDLARRYAAAYASFQASPPAVP